MTVKITVGGVDVSLLVDLSYGCEIRMPVSKRGATASFVLRDFGPSFNTALVNPLDIAKVYDVDGTTLLFSGPITKPEITIPSANVTLWHCPAVDASYYLEAPGTLVNKRYLVQTADAIVKDIFATYLPTITTAHVQAGPVIPAVVFSHKTVGQALRKLMKLAQQAQPIAWWVDPANDVHWYPIDVLPAAPIFLSDRDADLASMGADGVSATGAVSFERDSFRLSLDGQQIVNNVTVRGGFALSAFQAWDFFVGNGHQSSFPTSYSPSQQQGATLPTVTVNGVSKTVAYDTGVAPTTDFLISYTGVGAATQTLVGTAALKTGTAATPAVSDQVVLSYQYDLPVLVTMSDPASITEYDTAGSLTSGRHSVDIYDQTITTFNAARAKAQSRLKVAAYHIPTIDLVIPEQYKAVGLSVGQSIRVVCGQIALDDVFAIIGMTITFTPNAQRRIALTLEAN